MFCSLFTRSLYLTSVFGSQPEHESQWEDLGPGRLPLLEQNAEQEGRGRQGQLLHALEGGADVQEAPVVAAAQETLPQD